MTVSLPKSTAEAVLALAKLIRSGVLYARGSRMKQVRRHYLPQLKRSYERPPSIAPVLPAARALISGIERVICPVRLNCTFPLPQGCELPPTWSARFFERLEWPVPRRSLEPERHPFRWYLEIQRGAQKVTFPVHDSGQRWRGPSFKASFGRLTLPMQPPIAVTSYLVFRDDLTDQALCQWLTVLLAQRSFLTDAEEEAAIRRYFLPGASTSEELAARLEAYATTKRRFLQPLSGHPSFPSYYQKSLRIARLRMKIAERDVYQLAVDEFLALKEIRWSEPALHRALLDRIADGRVKTITVGNTLCVSTIDLERVDEARRRNAILRQPKRLPDCRRAWIDELVRRGERRLSATRKVKRWINVARLSAEEIAASIARGRLVRFKRPGTTR